MKRKVLVLEIAALAAFTMVAQEKKELAEKAASPVSILHPEMKVETGTWDNPAATLGAKPDQPWSTTSVAAGVDSKPQPGSATTKVGEIVDFSCYIQLGKHGEKTSRLRAEMRQQRPADRTAYQGWIALHADAGRA